MRFFCLLPLTILATGMEANAQRPLSPARPAAVLELSEADRNHSIDIQVTIDGQPFDKYWTGTFDAIFNFADTDNNGVLSEKEIRLVPSARAVRLSLGNAFAPPVAAIQSLREIVAVSSQQCTKDQLRQYYLQNGAGQLQIGTGKLPHTAALTAALLQALDQDQDQRLSQAELQRADTALRLLDTNDDELIGVGELVPKATYPGCWAAKALPTDSQADLSTKGDRSLLLKRLKNAPPDISTDKAGWQITVSDDLSDQPLQVATHARCESWAVPGPINELYAQLREEIANADPEPPKSEPDQQSRNRRPSRAWLTPLADRDRSGDLSQQEIDQWLALQQRLIHGQLLVSIYPGGGLFELLDSNHDAGLSIRELRGIWQTLKAASCTSGSHVDLKRVPHVVLFVVSQGYPDRLAKSTTAKVEWFRLMDRNQDGDVSRREFTGPPAAFDRLDQNHDDLISPREAMMQN